MEASYASVLDRVEQVLERRGPDDRPSDQELDDLYTDACATVLLLEGEMASVERRLARAAAGDDEGETIRRARDLARRRIRLDENLIALRALVDRLNPVAGVRRFS